MENQKFELAEVSFSSISGVRNKNLATLDSLIMECYFKVFHDRKDERLRDERVPKVKDVYIEVAYQFEKRGFEKHIGVGDKVLSEENVAMFLIRNKCVIGWGFAIVGNCQLEMFPDIMGESTVLI